MSIYGANVVGPGWAGAPGVVVVVVGAVVDGTVVVSTVVVVGTVLVVGGVMPLTHGLPFIVHEDGGAYEPEYDTWKPKTVLVPGAKVLL
jgi:hypothetical protein